MKIEIVKGDGNNLWFISYGNQVSDSLCFDEALGVVASLLLGVKPRYMQTMEQWWHHENRHFGMDTNLLRLADQRVIAGHVIQIETPRKAIREVVREKQFPNL